MSKPVQAWMPLYIGDYLADTAHLTAAESGAYLHLIMHYWRNGPLVDDDRRLMAIARMSPADWRRARSILAEFFRVRDGEWHHKRIDAELESATANAARRSEKARAAANARHDRDREHRLNHAPSTAPSMPQAVPVECPPPSPSPKSRKIGESTAANVVARDANPVGEAPTPDDLRAVHDIARAAGVDHTQPSRIAANIDLVRQWGEWGLGRDEIMSVIRSRVALADEPIGSLRYFTPAIRQHIARQEAGPPPPSSRERKSAWAK